MNLERRISKLEYLTMPQKRIVSFSNMETAVRIVYLLDRAQRGKPIQIGMKAAARLVDLIKGAAKRSIIQNSISSTGSHLQ